MTVENSHVREVKVPKGREGDGLSPQEIRDALQGVPAHAQVNFRLTWRGKVQSVTAIWRDTVV